MFVRSSNKGRRSGITIGILGRNPPVHLIAFTGLLQIRERQTYTGLWVSTRGRGNREGPLRAESDAVAPMERDRHTNLQPPNAPTKRGPVVFHLEPLTGFLPSLRLQFKRGRGGKNKDDDTCMTDGCATLTSIPFNFSVFLGFGMASKGETTWDAGQLYPTVGRPSGRETPFVSACRSTRLPSMILWV